MLASEPLSAFMDPEAVPRKTPEWMAFLKKHVWVFPDAQSLYDAALEQGLRERKQLLVQLGGRWCPGCVVLARYLHRHDAIIAKDYIHLKLDEQMPHNQKVYQRIVGREARLGSIPWFAIVNGDGKTLATSDRPVENIGFPGESRTGRKHFENMLKSTSK